MTTTNDRIISDVCFSTRTVTFTTPNGDEIVICADELNDEIKTMAMLHGIKQKVGDAAAIAKNKDTGKSATTADKAEAMAAIAERLLNGDWNVRTTGTSADGTLLVQALVQLMGKTRNDVIAFLETKTKEQKKALRANPKIAAKIAEIQSAHLGIDSDALLAELGD